MDPLLERRDSKDLHVQERRCKQLLEQKEGIYLLQNGKEEVNVDIVQKSIGVLGRWHIWVCVAIFLVKFPVAWHQLSIVFVAPPVNFTCATPEIGRCWKNCSSHEFDRSVFTETITTQWDLVCDRGYLESLAQTTTMLGILFGNMIFGYLSDRYGRKNPLLWAVIIQVTTGVGAAASPWLPLFFIMRFFAALATGGTMVTSFVLVMELIGTEWRTVLGILYQIPFNLGHLTLPLFAYFLRDWRYFQAAISIPSAFLIIYYWVLPESPRWLLTVGKSEEAIKTMESAAKSNRLSTASIKQDVENYLAKKEKTIDAKHGGNILDLVRTPIMRLYTIAVCFNWFVCGLCFFGVSQFVGQLGGNIFLNVALSAIIQVPSSLFSIYATKSWGRKYTLIFGNLVAGIFIFLIGFAPKEPAWLQPTLSTVGVFGLGICFPTVYIYSGELFPTFVRNIGVGTSSMSARIGSMIAPFVATLVKVEPWLPPVIFGVTPIAGAILCLILPETLDCKLPNTIEEAEEFHKKGRKAKTTDTEMG